MAHKTHFCPVCKRELLFVRNEYDGRLANCACGYKYAMDNGKPIVLNPQHEEWDDEAAPEQPMLTAEDRANAFVWIEPIQDLDAELFGS